MNSYTQCYLCLQIVKRVRYAKSRAVSAAIFFWLLKRIKIRSSTGGLGRGHRANGLLKFGNHHEVNGCGLARSRRTRLLLGLMIRQPLNFVTCVDLKPSLIFRLSDYNVDQFNQGT
ncbi:hypothetical protein Pint_28061 [Pistacia integerrima]|uniref:Uncharacterized protein n=1 Tax=Pistacia integerrima TaxID=434235 RepID=A0ACC0YP97_9ROSI|nr:hypothetical protein Pint_28061 [Pistacia integerrima]